MTRVLLARLDSDGDVLLAGPAARAVAAGADEVVLLAGPRGAAAARLLPGVDEVLVWSCPWIEADPVPLDPGAVERLVGDLRERRLDAALVLTSFHQSPLPLALVLRLAGVPWVGAVSEDYPGSLLDLRHRLPDTGLHEAERMRSLATAAGFPLPSADDGGLALRRPLPDTRHLTGDEPYVVVHPGASVPARAPSPAWFRRLVPALRRFGVRVIVTGGPSERSLTRSVVASSALDLGGRTDLAGLADVLDRAEAVVVGNTGPAHLAAAVGTPVVSLFAPVVPAERWRPFGVEHVLLGDQLAPCAATRARACPVPGHPCLDGIDVGEVVDAVRRLTRVPARKLQVTA
ncbi:MAG: glycosyltransferase family 9 protein [Actinobacteria bacterium]|nr:glycosyltransferase family 9 protein [Actinomycetota bacterium]MBW3646282.1 glycosyltransferase family 9 protein [Actinomycetota bacterium]